MATLNETPSANRLHIGIFGKTNSGKSSFINALTAQEVSIVADVAGTTTDPVYKAMEINPLGACVLIDTAGFDDDSALGGQRLEKTKLAAEKTDIAVLVISAEELKSGKDTFEQEKYWYHYFAEKKTPVLVVINKADIMEHVEISPDYREHTVVVSAKTGLGMEKVKEELSRRIPENYGQLLITGNLVQKEDLVMLVMPQDIQAPKGRLILPQVQTLRELLDKKCHVMCVTKEEFSSGLELLKMPPKLIITDSQIFPFVAENKPEESMLTSFSVLFAAYKGDIEYYRKGAEAIDSLTEQSRVLIAECCTHAPLTEDIGREKLPRLLKKRIGEGLQVTVVSGTDFPEDLSGYDLIIQCGACMFNRKYVLSRIDRAKTQGIPMTNYGVAIAHVTGILQQVVY
jgi:[FeFe] hydrogenase H-cluster maturation GTPase HydF